MYVNFKKVLIQKEPIKIPKEIISQLNKNLPKGLEYIEIGENACGITSKDDLNITLSILIPDISEKYSEIIKTSDDLLEYIYRTQTKLICKPNKDGTITVNNYKVPYSDFIKFPLSDSCLHDYGEFSIIPQEFPEIGDVIFQTGDIKKSLKMKRVPYDSMDMISIESQDENWFKLRILLNEITLSATFNFIFKLELINEVDKLVNALKFHNSLFTNGVSMAGFELNGKISKDKIIPNETIEFWEKVLQLQKVLGLNFDCSIPITGNDAYGFHILFRNFIENKPYREDIKVEPNTGIYVSEIEEVRKQIGQEMGLIYQREIQWELQAQKFSTYAVTVLFNTIVDIINEIESKNDSKKYFIKLKSAEGKTMFQALRLFRTKGEAENYQLSINKNFNHYATTMREAEKIII
jgi:hypothetical protein